MLEYSLSNNKVYRVERKRDYFRVEEFDVRFDDLFYSTTGNVVNLDTFAEVREYLTEMNGGVEVYG